MQTLRLTPKELGRAAGAAFAREMKGSSRFLRSKQIIAAGLGLALAYTVLLTTVDEATRGAITGMTRGVVDLVAHVIPGIHKINADLAKRGFTARGQMMANIVAFQWIILGAGWVCAATLIVPERTRLHRAFAAARERSQRQPFPVSRWRWRVGTLVCVLLLVWWPFNGDSQTTGRYAYDLAYSIGGLFFPYLFVTFVWWVVAFRIWVGILASIGGEDRE